MEARDVFIGKTVKVIIDVGSSSVFYEYSDVVKSGHIGGYGYNIQQMQNIVPYALDKELTSYDYYRAIDIYQERLIFAGAKDNPMELRFSKEGEYYDFSAPSPIEDDDAISIIIASKNTNRILNLAVLNDLLAFTDENEFRVDGVNGILTPFSIRASVNSFYGSKDVIPLNIGSQVIFVDRSNNIMSLIYNYQLQGYSKNELSTLAYNLLKNQKIKKMVYKNDTKQIFLLLDDGTYLTITYNLEQKIVAFSRHETAGKVVDIEVLRLNDKEQVYFVVNRNNQYAIEVMDEEIYLDSYKLNANDGTGENNKFYGLNHLVGQKVIIINNGDIIEKDMNGNDLIVDNEGIVDLGANEFSETKEILPDAICGLNFESSFETFNMLATPSLIDKKVRIVKLLLLLYKSKGGKVAVKNNYIQYSESELIEYIDLYTDYTKEFSGKKQIGVSCSYDDEYNILFKQDLPLPSNIISIIPKIEVGGEL
jgi:hypothetical protein